MAIYGTGVSLLINMLIYIFATSTESQIGVLAYADDFSVAGKLGDLRNWWQTFIIGPKFVTTRNLQKHGLWSSHMHRSEQLRYFVEAKLRSPMKGTDTLEKKLKHRNLKNNYMEEKVIK